MTTWKIGQQAVCISDGAIDGGEFHLTKGQVYTVEEINLPWLRVIDDRKKLGGWHKSHFRPVHTLLSDVRKVKAALRDMPASERLDRLAELLNE